jgi:hypothetical protein
MQQSEPAQQQEQPEGAVQQKIDLGVPVYKSEENQKPLRR